MEKKYIKAKKTFNEVVDTDLADNKILKESIHYIWMAAINIDSVMRIGKKNLTLSLPTRM